MVVICTLFTLKRVLRKFFLHSSFTMVRPRTTVLPLFTTMLGQTHREVIASTKFSRLACKWSRDQELHHDISKNRSSFSSAKCKKLSQSVHLQQEKLNWNGLIESSRRKLVLECKTGYKKNSHSQLQCLQPWLGAFSIFLPFFSIFMAISVFLTGVTSNSRKWEVVKLSVSNKTFFFFFFLLTRCSLLSIPFAHCKILS